VIMAIISCINNHYYDNSKYDSCPFCNAGVNDDDYRTVALYNNGQSQRETNDLEIKTISFYDASNSVEDQELMVKRSAEADLTVGWLVCLEGGSRGRDYRVVSGRNMVGRDYSMDICIQGDETISRENHCAVVYDDKHNLFYILPVNNMVYKDDKLLTEAVELKTGDEFVIGESRFVFVAFCEGDRKWKKD